MLSISTVAYQRNKIWVVKSAQDVNFDSKLAFPLSCFNCWQLHFLDCYNLQKETCCISMYLYQVHLFKPFYKKHAFCMEAMIDVTKSYEL